MKIWIMFGVLIISIFIINFMIGEKFPFTSALIEYVFESNFVTALAGAGFGAYAAINIGQNIEQRRELLKEIQQTNTAIVIAAKITISSIALNRHSFSPLLVNFNSAKNTFINYQNNNTFVKANYGLDLRSINPPRMDVDILKEIITTKINLAEYRELADVLSLVETYHLLLSTISSREKCIEIHNTNPKNLTVNNLDAYIFGEEYEPGVTDSRYEDNLNGMVHLSNDISFFASQIYFGLRQHGVAQLEIYKKLKGKAIEGIINSSDIDIAIKENKIPNYPDDNLKR